MLHADEVARRLRDLREVFLTRYIYKTYSGYVLSQFRRMANAHAKTGKYKAKHAMHLIRLLYSGVEALSFEQARDRALALDREFQEAHWHTSLPEQPDYRRVDDFLIWARRRMVDA